jgi:CCR4-NOT transcription complex subunit 2
MAHLFSGGGSGGFPSGFPGQQQNQQQNIPSSSRSTFGMNLINSSSGQPSMSAGTPGLNALSGSFASFSAASATGLAAASGSSGRLFSRSDRSGKIGDPNLLSPNAFDPSEFPSLGNRDNSGAPNPSLSARPNYVGMVKQPAMEPSEFTMSHEDFPALPGVPASSSAAVLNSTAAAGQATNTIGDNPNDLSKLSRGGMGLSHQDLAATVTSQSMMGSRIGGPGAIGSSMPLTGNQSSHLGNVGSITGGVLTDSGGTGSSHFNQQQANGQHKRGIQTSPDGRVTHIPQSMVTDQFGMIGLLTFIRAAETDPNLVSLALGADLTTLGLNLNSEVNLYPTFGGPWAETPCRPQDIDFPVPYEYLTNVTIRDKLAPVKLNRYKDDVLFYMFYTNVGDVLQLAAAAELYNRDWRYHKDDRVWITRAPGMAPSEKTQSYERGTYYFFDVTNWRKVSKEFHLDYDKLEDRPSLPTNLSSSSGTVASSGSGVAGVGTGSASVHQPSSNSPAPPGMPGGGGAPHPAVGPGGIPPSTPSSASQHSPIGGVVAPGLNAVGGGPNL